LGFHQALWDDLTNGVWNNFNDYIGRFYQACETYAGGVTSVSIPICKLNVNVYFGGSVFGLPDYAAFQLSQAATDTYASRYGQVCTNVAATLAQNQCSR
jgi:hypothetical protein